MSVVCPKEVGALLGISEATARRLMRGEIASFRVGSKLLRTYAKDVAAYIERQRVNAPQEAQQLRAAA